MEFCKVACVLAGGGIGSVARFFIASEIHRLFPDFSPNLRAFLFVGLLGGFTTFSSFSLETMNLLNLGKVHSALSYIIGTNLGGIIAVFGGFFLAKYSLHMIKFL